MRANRGMSVIERFWSKVKKTDDCWLWVGNIHYNGYGQFVVDRQHRTAHRWLYEYLHGPVGKDDVCHTCDVRHCVNPAHLFRGTRSDNMYDCSEKGRNAMQLHPERSHFATHNILVVHGERHGHAKLTAWQVEEIRKLRQRGISGERIASQFGISAAHARKIGAGLQWKHLEGSI